jgi:polysaccharide export outer membrane protein
MKNKIGNYTLFCLLLLLMTSCASKNFIYFQSKEDRKGQIFDLPSYRNESTVRFQPDDVLGITVNVPGEQAVASDYNLPLVPAANSENSSADINLGIGRQTFLIDKDGTIDFPVLGTLKVAGYTQSELEKYLKERLSEKLVAQSVVTVRLLNFTIYFIGEVNSPGPMTVTRDNINLLQALSLARDLTPYGKRDDIRIFRQKPDGGYTEMSLDISKEDIISSPYYFLQQNDQIYVPPTRVKSQSADISPRYSFILGVASLAFSLYFLIKK